jgi:hypothetical protein
VLLQPRSWPRLFYRKSQRSTTTLRSFLISKQDSRTQGALDRAICSMSDPSMEHIKQTGLGIPPSTPFKCTVTARTRTSVFFAVFVKNNGQLKFVIPNHVLPDSQSADSLVDRSSQCHSSSVVLLKAFSFE